MSRSNVNHEILLRLSVIPGIGPTKIRALIARYGFSKTLFTASVSELSQVVGRRTAEKFKEFDGRDFAEDQLQKSEKEGVQIVSFWDKEYPSRLKQIYDPPPYIFLKGSITTEDSFAIGVVGTRKPSDYGRMTTEKLTSELGRKGFTIVSGLAFGVDTIAHQTALKSGARTLAVFGSGVDVIYPHTNKRLAKEITENGALISEFALGTQPDRNNFPQRNRIISGLSLGTLVIEAGQKSGALITAEQAVEQNREVFAVPGNISNPKSYGTNDLIKQGAKLVTSSDDIIEELRPRIESFLQKAEISVDISELNAEEKKMIDLLDHQPRHIDVIAKQIEETTAKALSVLLSLELKGLVKQFPGTQFIKL
ncbi:MAG: DNA-processing protein DprA [bacterium]